jgi:hypothetical protein
MASFIKTYDYPITADVTTHIQKKLRNINYLDQSSPIFFISNIHKVSDYSRNANNVCQNQSNILDIINTSALTTLDTKNDYIAKSCDPLIFEYEVQGSEERTALTRKPRNYVSEILNAFKFSEGKYKSMLNVLGNIGLNTSSEITSILAEVLVLPEVNTIACFGICPEPNVNTLNRQVRLHSLTANKFMSTLNEFQNLLTRTLDSGYSAYIKQYENRNIECQRDIDILYITKLFTKKESNICLFGDIHGAVHTLTRSLLRLFAFGYINKDFILNSNFYIVFLGDLVDRGLYSLEIIYLVMKLKILNPNNVFIIRGNHELCSVNYRYGLKANFGKLDSSEEVINQVYCKYCYSWSFLPAAIFLREEGFESKYIQLCHGGIHHQIGIIDSFLRDNTKLMYVFYNKMAQDASKSIQWGDFESSVRKVNMNLIEDEKYGFLNPSRGYKFSSGEVIEYLNRTIIKQVVRGHQDTFDTTKILYHPANSSFINPAGFKHHPNRKNYFTKLSNSYNIPVPNDNEDIYDYTKKHLFVPVLTLTTGASSRYVDCDGFSILVQGPNIKL